MNDLERPCPLCEGCACSLRYSQRLTLPVEFGFVANLDVVTCDRCGFAFANVPLSQRDIDRTYEDHSKYADDSLIASAASDPPWDVDRLRSVATWLANQVDDRTTRVLDVGAAGGSFLAAMRDEGFASVLGIDPSPAAARLAKQRNNIEVIAGSFLTPPPNLGSFGLVTLQHTLEHLRDVRGSIAFLRAVLDDGGLAYLEVPDARRYADFVAAPFQDFNTEHINHFSLAKLAEAMSNAGFIPIATGEKAIFASASHRAPAAYGLWRKTSPPSQAAVSFDAGLVEAIERFVRVSEAAMRHIDEALRAQLHDDREVVLWGTGQLAFKLLADTVLREKRVTLVDASPRKQGLHVGGSPIAAPESLGGSHAPIVVGSILAADAIAAAIAGAYPHRRVVRLPEAQPVSG